MKVAVITGGGSGIGLAIAKKFIAAGYQVIVIGRTESKLKQAVSDLGDQAAYKVCDLTDLKNIPKVITEIHSEYGRVDVLVNNAGINMKKPFTEVTDEDFFQVINTNLLSVFAISREVVKVMDGQGGGSIIHISSMSAHYGVPKIIAYSASKTAVEGMTRAMAVELAPMGIRVNCIAPGFIVTEMTDKALNSDTERKAKVMGRTPMGRMGQPAEIGDTAVYFASEAASYITGTVLPVDGGNSIGF